MIHWKTEIALEPEELATEALTELESAVAELKLLTTMLENGSEATVSTLAEKVPH